MARNTTTLDYITIARTLSIGSHISERSFHMPYLTMRPPVWHLVHEGACQARMMSASWQLPGAALASSALLPCLALQLRCCVNHSTAQRSGLVPGRPMARSGTTHEHMGPPLLWAGQPA